MEMRFTIDRLEGKQAVLKNTQGQTILWPVDQLPVGVKAGEVIRFIISRSGEETAASQQIAKDILNEILENN